MSDAQLQQLSAVVATASPSVGVIQIDFGGMNRFASCFRVSSDGRRVVTAKHVAYGLLSENAKLNCSPDATPTPPRSTPGTNSYRKAQVLFEAQTGFAEEICTIEAIEWAHDYWDLMFLRLEQASQRPPLQLAMPDDAPQSSGWTCALGYPLSAPADPQFGGFLTLFSDALGVKRASPGIINPPNTGERPGNIRHDATTLGGNSGGPVISLETGKVIGLHYRGGTGPASPNMAIQLSEALKEDTLRGRMMNDPGLIAQPPQTWRGHPQPGNIRGKSFNNIRSGSDEYAGIEVPSLADAVGVLPDRFDSRDCFYQAPLLAADVSILPPHPTQGEIGKQMDPYSCTGFALAAAINRQLLHRGQHRNGDPLRVSPAMIYALAVRNDEFIDDLPGGSSLRGAIKGFYHYGACLEQTAPYSGFDPDWHLTIEAAKESRQITLGAYYRLRPALSDYHLAIKEVGAVLVSAHLHKGWDNCKHKIIPRIGCLGAHAFIITGYDTDGFIIQNSWGEDWASWQGRKGMAHWSYADWAENVIDAWVLRLAPPTPNAFDLQVRNIPIPQNTNREIPPSYARLRNPRRSAIVGHCLHVERYGIRCDNMMSLNLATIRETALYLNSDMGRKKYPALALIFHDAATSPDLITRLAAHMIKPLKDNRIYPIHIHYGADEMRSLVVRMQDEANTVSERARGSGERLTGFLQRRALTLAQPLMRSWIEGCRAALAPGGGLWQALALIGLEAGGPPNNDDSRPRQLHVLGIGSGGLVADLMMPVIHDLGFGVPDSLGGVGTWALPGRELPQNTRHQIWQLDCNTAADVALSGFDGDWCDLLALLSDAELCLPRHNDRVKWGADLASAITQPSLLNSVLQHMLDRKPARTRCFV